MVPIRLLQVTRTLDVGGMEQVVATLCRSLDRSAYAVEVLCLRGRGALAEALAAEGIPVHLLDSPTGRADYLAAWRVARWLRHHPVDVMHTHNTTALLFGALGAWLAGVPRIIHTDHARLYPERFRIAAAEHVASRVVERVAAVSDATAADLHRHLRIPTTKLVTIPNGIEGSRYRIEVDRNAKLAELGLEGRGPILGLGARLTEQKGLAVLLQALPALIQRYPRLVLLVAGEGPLAQRLQEQAEQLGVGEHVRFLGLRLDMPELLQLFDVYVLPSIWEGLPMAVLEALAAGCPIVASDVGGVSTAVRHGDTGHLVPPGDPAALAAAIDEVVADSALRARYRERGRALFEAHYSAAAMAQAYDRLYRGGQP